MKYIILNFSYGYGPFLRALEVAVALNNLREQAGKERLPIIMPWVYGNKQKEIIIQDFGRVLKNYPEEIFFDNKLGEYLKDIFYSNGDFWSYSESYLLKFWDIEQKVKDHFSKGFTVVSFDGNIERDIIKNDIVLEIARAPRLFFGINYSIYFSFGYLSDIFGVVMEDRHFYRYIDLISRLKSHFKNLEDKYNYHFIAYPGTMSGRKNYIPARPTEILTPPHISDKKCHESVFDNRRAVYVNLSGIDKALLLDDFGGMCVCTNRPDKIKNALGSPPSVLERDNFIGQIARSGWGAIWTSVVYEKPFFFFPYDFSDDPEIMLNNKLISELGIGAPYNKTNLSDKNLMQNLQSNLKKLKIELMEKFGHIYGDQYIAKYTYDKLSNINI